MKLLIADGCPEATSYLLTIMEEIPRVDILPPTSDGPTTLSSI